MGVRTSALTHEALVVPSEATAEVEWLGRVVLGQ